MSVKVFVDTNVLVYSRDASEPGKQKQAMAWMTSLWTSQTGRLSFQVLQEFYSTVTIKLHPGMDRQRARDDVQTLMAWSPLPVNRRCDQNRMVTPGSIQALMVGFAHSLRGSN